MKNIIIRNLNGKKILILFILTNIVYTVMLTITIPNVMSYAGGMKTLDMIPTGYNADYVNSFLSALGTDGRNAYLFQQIPLDLIYPGLFAITYCLLYAFLLKKLGRQDSFLFYFAFIPLFAGFFDYLENVGIIALLNSYPNNSIAMAEVTNVFSLLKSGFSTIYFIVLIFTLLALLIKYVVSKSRKSPTQ